MRSACAKCLCEVRVRLHEKYILFCFSPQLQPCPPWQSTLGSAVGLLPSASSSVSLSVRRSSVEAASQALAANAEKDDGKKEGEGVEEGGEEQGGQ